MKKNYGPVFLMVLTALSFLGTVRSQITRSVTEEEKGIFEKAKKYIQNALTGQWQYRCRENIRREENTYEVVLTKTSFGEYKRRWELRKTKNQEGSFDYRLWLKGKKINERRLAVSTENALLYEGKDYGNIFPYKDKNIIYNPMDYLSRIARGTFEYHAEGSERIEDWETRIIRFKSDIITAEKQGTLAGRMWVRPETGEVLRVALEPESWNIFESEDIPKVFSAVPNQGHPSLRRSLSWTADFGIENRGVRFPSRIEISEEYFEESGERLRANRWEITANEFQFEPSPTARPVISSDRLLAKAGEYCEQLKSVALQYICDEHIVRTSYLYSVRRYTKSAGELPRKRWELKRTSTKEAFYDYQLNKKGDRLEEKRNALKYGGKKWTKKEDPPNLLPYQAQYIVYGPVGFLSKYWQKRFDYFEEGREELSDGRTSVVLTSQPNDFREENGVYGRIWVDEETGAVLRISWDPDSIEFFHPEEVPEAFIGLEKRLVWTADYEVEKNGVYFPSRQEIREEYVGPAGELIVGDVWIITYEKYRFFVVGTEVDIKD